MAPLRKLFPLLACLSSSLSGLANAEFNESNTVYPLPNVGNLPIHDPAVLRHPNGTYFAFKGGVHIPYYRSEHLNGTWEQVGTILQSDSIIPNKQNATRPWAPHVVYKNGTFYCYYTLSQAGCRDSAIGVATSNSLEPGTWTDHGALVATWSGKNSQISPYNISNAIDPSVLIDDDGKGYMTYGSYWSNIWELPLSDTLLAIETPHHPDARHLSYYPIPGKPNHYIEPVPECKDPQGSRHEEGSFLSKHNGTYYLWFAHGKCCDYSTLPEPGTEYSIRVGKSSNVGGPFVDKSGKKLLQGGGTVVYASNHGNIFAPGGPGVVPASGGESQDILVYHYLDRNVGLNFADTKLGYSYLTYDEEGWPTAQHDPIE
ncbi:uncharacterized protein TRUGW13939_04508 [Talaromyces rugulosus]|uniref:Arabinan endo-1,5-alpha-L-arabinosidase n=1 Tax=Talaromyces rugulosus TaxID=121627 RepID=A0A7H8QUB7_TALRU|nr:uncharacterized protein TRUGW13939_04508 [Talaromyces rugulosus]QKX57396.1 hypothetical protein TRUGW13939_04508 [Talaromyces rugulosus]